MQIQSSTQLDLNLYKISKDRADKPDLAADTNSGLYPNTDTVEISPAARQLQSEIVHQAAVYFGTAQINDSLNRVLSDQSPEVKEAVYGLIQSNFITNVTDEDERSALLESGLKQAQHIADTYLKNENAAEFMNTIRQIGDISKTRTIDPETKQIRYETPSQRPVGAPIDYINLNELMQKSDPKTYEKLQAALANGSDWFGILQAFAKKISGR
ncbi:hypothetical protein [Paenibacillus sp. NPDC058071]|uniref:hypothetical protein n=1 Tax=Paenibacillus sp. NPDC058071 TaxID=3346326 RepID=UPI0036DB2CD5